MKQLFSPTINRLALSCVTLTLLAVAQAQEATDAPPPPADPAGVPASLPPDKIDDLVGPIALYPDVLVSQILPASTFPMDVVRAARWLRSKPDMSTLAKQEWDLSVLSLCHYPEVIYKMDEDLDWTSALGATFLAQPNDVMDSVQRLRLLAQKSGALKTNDQQTVVVEKETIRVVPSEPQVVYVPTYNPQVVYVEQQSNAAAVATASAISFGVGLAMGTWLNNDCDWHGRAVVYCKPGYWGGYRYAGAVKWNDNWAAAVGPRRAAVVGPSGAAVWRRPTAYGAPAYGGRYASYNSYRGNNYAGAAYRGNTAVGNNTTINRNNVNIDRGDRNTAIAGDRNTAIGNNRYPNAGANRPGAGQAPGSPTQLPANGDRTPGTARPGAPGNAGQRPTQLPANGAAGQRPTQLPANGAAGQRPTQLPSNGAPGQRPTQLPSNGTGGRTPDRTTAAGANRQSGNFSGSGSAFGNSSGASQTRDYSNRGSASRSSAGMSRSGGGGGSRSGGGGGRGRR